MPFSTKTIRPNITEFGRRQFLVSGVAGAVFLSSCTPKSSHSTDILKRNIVDMTHTLNEDFPTYFGEQQFKMTPKFTWAEHNFNLLEYNVNEHTGTHIDAPIHFSENGHSVDEIPLEDLIAPLCVVDIRARGS